MKNIIIITNFPSYHNVDLFNAIYSKSKVNIKVYYLIKMPVDRQWKKQVEIRHPHEFLQPINITSKVYYNKNLLDRVKKDNPDLVIISQYASLSMQQVMYYLIRKNKNFVFWSEKAGIPYYEAAIIKFELLRKAFRFLAMLPLRSKYCHIWAIGRRAYFDYKILTRNQVLLYPYFFDTNRFISASSDKRMNNKRPIRLLFCGKFNKRKGFDLLIKALPDLLADNSNFEFWFVGDGPFKDQLQSLKSIYPSRIKYLGFVEREEVPNIMTECDILVFPSRYDGWGMVLHEAMSVGLPAIASIEAGSTTDSIIDGYNGLVMVPSMLDLRRCIQILLINPEILSSIKSRCQETALRYDSSIGADLFVNYINNVIE